MVRNNGRWGRLRRVLNEDLSSSTAVHTGSEIDRTPGDTLRYGAGANIENHPQITDYIPRRLHITALVLLVGVLLGLAAEATAHYSDFLSETFGVSPTDLVESLTDGLISWTAAVTLLVAAAYSRIVFLLKRHRLDDLRGRYRVWRQASLLAILFSASYVSSAHAVVATAVGHTLNIHPFDSDVIWWLLPTALVGSWVMIRLLLDAAECRMALAAFLIAFVSFTGAAISATGWLPAELPVPVDSLDRVLFLSGSLMALAGTLFTARYVVLDVQGLIEHPVVEMKAKTTAIDLCSPTFAANKAEEPTTAWTDGTEPDDDYSDDDRPLTKAERKRLRKQHGRYRAA